MKTTSAIFNSAGTDLNYRNGEKVKVLGVEETDTGKMYDVRFSDGSYANVYASELGFSEGPGVRIAIKFGGNLYTAFDADTGDELGEGSSADGAIGASVRNLLRGAAWNDSVVIKDVLYWDV